MTFCQYDYGDPYGPRCGARLPCRHHDHLMGMPATTPPAEPLPGERFGEFARRIHETCDHVWAVLVAGRTDTCTRCRAVRAAPTPPGTGELRRWGCSYCGAARGSEGQLRQHMSKAHPDEGHGLASTPPGTGGGDAVCRGRVSPASAAAINDVMASARTRMDGPTITLTEAELRQILAAHGAQVAWATKAEAELAPAAAVPDAGVCHCGVPLAIHGDRQRARCEAAAGEAVPRVCPTCRRDPLDAEAVEMCATGDCDRPRSRYCREHERAEGRREGEAVVEAARLVLERSLGHTDRYIRDLRDAIAAYDHTAGEEPGHGE